MMKVEQRRWRGIVRFYLLAALPVLAATVAFRAVGSETSGKDLALRLEVDRHTVRFGEPLKLTTTVVNQGKTPIFLPQPGDGSDYGWRTPITGCSILRAGDPGARHPARPPLETTPRCGNINAVAREGVVRIPPGGRQRVGTWCRDLEALPNRQPGTYRIVVYYFNDPAMEWKGIVLGKNDPEAMRKIRQSPECSLISNEVVIEVLPR